ncbi:MAG TPA: hypothetical protein VKS21_08385, partial [Spirochaetota bacterium]|nr:hypothetical protein [Spirochaetota bacterium]
MKKKQLKQIFQFKALVLLNLILLTVTCGDKDKGTNPDADTGPYTVTTRVVPPDSGTVYLAPSGPSYESGTAVTVSVAANSGYTFSKWSNDLSGSVSPANVTVNNDLLITAVFTDGSGSSSSSLITSSSLASSSIQSSGSFSAVSSFVSSSLSSATSSSLSSSAFSSSLSSSFSATSSGFASSLSSAASISSSVSSASASSSSAVSSAAGSSSSAGNTMGGYTWEMVSAAYADDVTSSVSTSSGITTVALTNAFSYNDGDKNGYATTGDGVDIGEDFSAKSTISYTVDNQTATNIQVAVALKTGSTWDWWEGHYYPDSGTEIAAGSSDTYT